MLGKTSKDFRTLFLVEFTKEVLRHSLRPDIDSSASGEISGLKQTLKKEKIKSREEKAEIKKRVKQVVRGEKPFGEEEILALAAVQPIQKTSQRPIKRVLRVPKTRLPTHLQYLKPFPSRDIELELGKLDALVKDPMVRDIECNGPNDQVVVKGVFGEKKTNIVLTREEIDEIVKKFSKATKIPVHQGLFKVVVGKLIFSAIVSEITGSKFIIKKMTYSPYFTG